MSDSASLERLQDPTFIREIIFDTLDLSDDAFTDLINDIGSRAALVVLRAKALSGNIRALDLYLRRCDDWRARKASGVEVTQTPENVGFTQKARNLGRDAIDVTPSVTPRVTPRSKKERKAKAGKVKTGGQPEGTVESE